MRNPIIGQNVPDASKTKPRNEWQPSKTYNKHNMRRYMLPADMKPLSELYKTSQRTSRISSGMRSSIFASANPQEDQNQRSGYLTGRSVKKS